MCQGGILSEVKKISNNIWTFTLFLQDLFTGRGPPATWHCHLILQRYHLQQSRVIPPSDAGICETNSHWIQQVYRHRALITPTWFDNVTLPRQKRSLYAKYSICERDIVTWFCRLVQRSEATIYFCQVTSEYPARWLSQVKLARDLPQVMTQPSRHDCTRDTATKYCHIARHGVYTTLHCHVR